ncbi:MAG: hypothetical protein K5744_05550 [Eubacterium sp.]|nr:hypothetical protein [Eubacterium sp.]
MTKKKRIVLGCFLIMIIVMLMSSTGFMVRAAVFVHSPRCAMTMEYEIRDGENKKTQLCVITKNAPVEEATQGVLTTWIIYHVGPFKFVKYYGEV